MDHIFFKCLLQLRTCTCCRNILMHTSGYVPSRYAPRIEATATTLSNRQVHIGLGLSRLAIYASKTPHNDDSDPIEVAWGKCMAHLGGKSLLHVPDCLARHCMIAQGSRTKVPRLRKDAYVHGFPRIRPKHLAGKACSGWRVCMHKACASRWVFLVWLLGVSG
jgi:hypothetical protein